MRFNLFILIFYASFWQISLQNKPVPKKYWTDLFLNYVASVFDYFPISTLGSFIEDEAEFKDLCDGLHVNHHIIYQVVNQRYKDKLSNRAAVNIYLNTIHTKYAKHFCLNSETRRKFVEVNRRINKYQDFFEGQRQLILKIVDSIRYTTKMFGFPERQKYLCCMCEKIKTNLLTANIDQSVKNDILNRTILVIKPAVESVCFTGDEYLVPKYDCRQNVDFSKLPEPKDRNVDSRPISLTFGILQMLGQI